MLPFRRDDVESWKKVFHELCTIARIPCLAVGIRGAYDAYDVNWRAPMLEAYRTASPQPTLCPWFDTVGLPDMVNPPNVAAGQAIKFDFANSVHIVIGWEKYARVFFDAFANCQLEKSPRGKVLIPWWGIASDNGHGFTNQHQAQRLLDYIDQKCYALGLGGADHIVDKTWLEFAPDLRVYGVHDWFNPWKTPPAAASIRFHHGVTVGVTVPSFYDIINPDGNADTLKDTLAAMRAAHADYVLIESGTNFSEAAELMRDSTGNTHKLDAVRQHIELTQPQQPQHEDDMAISATFSLRRSERTKHPTRPGYFTSPYPGTTTGEVLSVNPPDGHIEPRPAGQDGGYESWREGEGNRAVFDDVSGYTFAFPLVD